MNYTIQVSITTATPFYNGNLMPLFTQSTLQRLHLHFLHPSTKNVYHLLKQTPSQNTDDEQKPILSEITDTCVTYRKQHVAFFQFCSCIFPNQLMFSHEIVYNLIFIENTSILHIFETRTAFRRATVLRGKTRDD